MSRQLAFLGAGLLTLALVACGGATRTAEAPKPNDGLSQGRAAFLAHDCTKARLEAKTALRKNPAPAEAYFILGACDEIDSNSEEAITHYVDALTADPALVEASVHLSNIYLEHGRPEDAAKVAHLALQKSRDVPELHLVLAYALEREGEHAQAAKSFAAAADAFDRAVQKHPDDPRLHSRFGHALLVKGDDDGARREFARAMKLANEKSDQLEVFEEAAAGLSLLGDAKGCVAALDRALDVTSEAALSKKRAQIFRERAECRYRAKDLGGARSDANASLAIEPNLPLHLSAARWDEQAGDKAGCVRHYRAAAIMASSPKLQEEAELGAERCK
jgi:tetratricopeptide (TPR) repeat protein